MFISEEQLEERLKSPRNLANRIRNGRQINAIREESGPTNQETSNEIGSESLHQESIQFREIKRPGNNRPWLSQQERTRIFTEATSASLDHHENGKKVTQTEIALRHGVAVSTVSDIVNNVRRAENTPRAIKQVQMDQVLDEVREKAIDRLMSSLGQLTDDKINAHNAKDISSICSNMARVVQQTIPQESGPQAINLIVYTPEMRKESNFDVIEVE